MYLYAHARRIFKKLELKTLIKMILIKFDFHNLTEGPVSVAHWNFRRLFQILLQLLLSRFPSPGGISEYWLVE